MGVAHPHQRQPPWINAVRQFHSSRTRERKPFWRDEDSFQQESLSLGKKQRNVVTKQYQRGLLIQVGPGWSEYGHIQITTNSKSSGNQNCASHVLSCRLNSKLTWIFCLVLFVRINWDPPAVDFQLHFFHGKAEFSSRALCEFSKNEMWHWKILHWSLEIHVLSLVEGANRHPLSMMRSGKMKSSHWRTLPCLRKKAQPHCSLTWSNSILQTIRFGTSVKLMPEEPWGNYSQEPSLEINFLFLAHEDCSVGHTFCQISRTGGYPPLTCQSHPRQKSKIQSCWKQPSYKSQCGLIFLSWRPE